MQIHHNRIEFKSIPANFTKEKGIKNNTIRIFNQEEYEQVDYFWNKASYDYKVIGIKNTESDEWIFRQLVDVTFLEDERINSLGLYVGVFTWEITK